MGRRTLHSNQLFAERYEIIKVLGDGGMGTVYLALDKIIREEIALKVMHADYSEESKHVERFIREVQVSRKIANPHVVRTYDAGITDGQLFFTMECVMGDSLKQELKKGPLDPLDVASIMMQVCDGLAAIHATQVVHRDLKPANMIRSADGTIKIADFGIARNEMSQLTGHEEVIGSTAYMAPEIWSGKEIGPPADIYALGISAYELITGELPFRASTPAELMWKHLEQPAPAAKEAQPGIPGWLNDLILILLEKNPGARPCKAEEIRDFLMGHLDSDAVTDDVLVVHPSPTVLSTSEREVHVPVSESRPGYHGSTRETDGLFSEEIDPYSAPDIDAPPLDGTEYELEPFVEATGEFDALATQEIDSERASTYSGKRRKLSQVVGDLFLVIVLVALLLMPVSDYLLVRWKLALAARHGWQLLSYGWAIFAYYSVLTALPVFILSSLKRYPTPTKQYMKMVLVIFAIQCSFVALSLVALDDKLEGTSSLLQLVAYSSIVEPAVVKTLNLALLQPSSSVFEVVSKNGLVQYARNSGRTLSPLDWYYAMMFVYLFAVTRMVRPNRSPGFESSRLKRAALVLVIMSVVIGAERLLAPVLVKPDQLGIVERVSPKIGIFFPVMDWYSITCGVVNWSILLLIIFVFPLLRALARKRNKDYRESI